jgi:hypothetical protein
MRELSPKPLLDGPFLVKIPQKKKEKKNTQKKKQARPLCMSSIKNPGKATFPAAKLLLNLESHNKKRED